MIYRLINADVMDGLRMLGDERVDAIVTDPPYEFGFMGKAWDSTGISYSVPMWGEALRVLKPGGHLLAFGGSRTYHRMACAIEDAGFEIRDQLQWLYGSGFPKSLDVSKAIDKAAGAERRVIGEVVSPYRVDAAEGRRRAYGPYVAGINSDGYRTAPVSEPSTEDARKWQGWGTTLKPAHEPLVMARKPFRGTVAANVLQHGTGALNVNACRVPIDDDDDYARNNSGRRGHAENHNRDRATAYKMTGGVGSDVGRWPANVLLDEEAAAILDEQSGNLSSGSAPASGFIRNSDKHRNTYAPFAGNREDPRALYGDNGGASRFFYTSKSSRSEREEGMELMPESDFGRWSSGDANPGTFQSANTNRKARNHHPTVKPVDLMRWLVRLVTPPGGTVLDPFLGSGSTGMAAIAESFDFIGIDKEAEYVEIARRRIASVAPLLAREESQLDERRGV